MLDKLRFDVLEPPQGFDPLGFDDFVYNGLTASVKPEFQPRKYSSRLFYHKERGERNQLICGLLLAGFKPATIQKRSDQNPPDFAVTFDDGMAVDVEVTQGTTPYEKQLNNSILYMHEAIVEWFFSDADAQQQTRGWNLTFDMHSPIPAADFDDAYKEIQQFIVSEGLADYEYSGKLPAVPATYPILNRLGSKIICRRTEHDGLVWVKLSARSVSGPWEDAGTVLACIERKRDKALVWKDSPLWLVVAVDLPWDSRDTLRVLKGYISAISPFERLILCDGRHGLMISR